MPYSQYKEINEPWLKSLPSHWQLFRTKAVLKERSVKGFPLEPMLAATQTKGVVRKEDYDNRTVLALKDLHLLKLVKKGDFVISLRSFQGGIEYAREQGIISPAYTILYTKDHNHHSFLSRLFKSKPYIENLTLYVTGIRQGQNIDYEKLSRSVIPLPPIEEQNAIVHFLDYTEHRIKHYIRAKQKLIKLLEEEKQVMIYKIVTKGLHSQLSKKQTGVIWIKNIPQEWNISRLKFHIVKNNSGIWGSDFSENGTFVLRSTEQNIDGSWNITLPARRNLSFLEKEQSILKKGDLLITKSSGSSSHIGKTSYVTDEIEAMECGFSNFMQRIRLRNTLYPKYIWFLFNNRVIRDQLVFYSNSTTGLGNLTGSIIGDLWIPYPDYSEQIKICNTLDEISNHYDKLIHTIKIEIQLCKEYLINMIADVVTGKLDVRAAAAKLPEELEDEEIDVEAVEPEEDDELEEALEP